MAVCNLSPPRWPTIHDQQSLKLCWRSISGCCRANDHVRSEDYGGQYVKNKLCITNVYILRFTEAYLNGTINVVPRTQNLRLEPTCPAQPSKTRWLTVTSPGLAHQEPTGWVFGRVWNGTNLFLWPKSGPLVGCPDPLLTLIESGNTINLFSTCSCFLPCSISPSIILPMPQLTIILYIWTLS